MESDVDDTFADNYVYYLLQLVSLIVIVCNSGTVWIEWESKCDNTNNIVKIDLKHISL